MKLSITLDSYNHFHATLLISHADLKKCNLTIWTCPTNKFHPVLDKTEYK
jgi:hypothetical protein